MFGTSQSWGCRSGEPPPPTPACPMRLRLLLQAPYFCEELHHSIPNASGKIFARAGAASSEEENGGGSFFASRTRAPAVAASQGAQTRKDVWTVDHLPVKVTQSPYPTVKSTGFQGRNLPRRCCPPPGASGTRTSAVRVWGGLEGESHRMDFKEFIKFTLSGRATGPCG